MASLSARPRPAQATTRLASASCCCTAPSTTTWAARCRRARPRAWLTAASRCRLPWCGRSTRLAAPSLAPSTHEAAEHQRRRRPAAPAPPPSPPMGYPWEHAHSHPHRLEGRLMQTCAMTAACSTRAQPNPQAEYAGCIAWPLLVVDGLRHPLRTTPPRTTLHMHGHGLTKQRSNRRGRPPRSLRCKPGEVIGPSGGPVPAFRA